MKKNKNRIFIVAPNYDGDTLHQICKTTSKDSLDNIYMYDKYEEIDSTDNMKDAVKIARKHGAKRPSVI